MWRVLSVVCCTRYVQYYRHEWTMLWVVPVGTYCTSRANACAGVLALFHFGILIKWDGG
jgi:hypothetical protein